MIDSKIGLKRGYCGLTNDRLSPSLDAMFRIAATCFIIFVASSLKSCNSLVPIGTTQSNYKCRISPIQPETLYHERNAVLSVIRTQTQLLATPPSGASPNNSTWTAASNSNNNEEAEQTLYELLNSSPESTRAEIKTQYVQLVRKTHPDATSEDTSVEFQKIQSAWKTLSDPLLRKRYDRSLRAKEFTAEMEGIMDKVGKEAAPRVAKAFDDIAIPFLRRSAVIAAGFDAVRSDIDKRRSKSGSSPSPDLDGKTESGSVAANTTLNENSSSVGLGNIFANAIEAGRKAGKAVDRLELEEKARELEKRAKQEQIQARKLRDKLDSTLAQRVRLTLHTPGAKLSSLEALMILDGFNTVDNLSLMDIARMRHKVAYEIEQLEALEVEEGIKQSYMSQAEAALEEKKKILSDAQQNEKEAQEAEAKARAALEEAMGRVASAKLDIMKATKSLSAAEEERTRNEYSLEILKSNVEKRQEIVRQALRRKAEEVSREAQKTRGEKAEDIGIMGIVGDFGPLNARDATAKITTLKEEEHMLKIESARCEATADRLLSRSQKLSSRAESLEEDELVAMEELKEEVLAAAQEFSQNEEDPANGSVVSSSQENNFNPTENQSQKYTNQNRGQPNQVKSAKRQNMKKLGFNRAPDGRII